MTEVRKILDLLQADYSNLLAFYLFQEISDTEKIDVLKGVFDMHSIEVQDVVPSPVLDSDNFGRIYKVKLKHRCMYLLIDMPNLFDVLIARIESMEENEKF